MKHTNKKIAVVMHSLYPYSIPLFNRLSQFDNIKFKFFFDTLITTRRVWKIDKKNIQFEYSILKSLPIKSKHDKYISLNIISSFWRFNPDIIILYGFGPTCFQALCYSILRRKKIIIWGEMPWQIEKRRSLIRKLYRRIFFSFCTAGLASSTQTMEFFQKSRINRRYLALLSVDQVKKIPVRQYKIKNTLKLLYVGSIEHRKGIDLLLETFTHMLGITSKNLVLNLVGNTNIEPRYIEMLSRKYNQYESINFLQFSDCVEKCYLESDVFLYFTRSDAHAMVVPEAISYGLPIICSKYAGCVDDFVKDNGLIIDPHDIKRNAKSICEIIDNHHTLSTMSNNSLKIIQNNLNKHSAKNIIEMVRAI